jgi:glycerol dehydrogenase
MAKVFIAPRKYVQGAGVLNDIGRYAAQVGAKPLVLWDARVKEIVGEKVLAGLNDAAGDELFGGECTKAEAERIAGRLKAAGADVVIGVGGGKTLDTAKAAAHQAGTKVITVPTIASNDSPTSSFTVWYDEQGACTGFESWGANPDLVLVDTEVIAAAPVRTFIAGMGDALATWIEVDACLQGKGGNLAGGTATRAAAAIARLCFDILMEHGLQAKRDVEAGTVSRAVENVVEANTLLSGLGFESGGVATAHMVANALPAFPECHGLMHGEEVGFGLITQLCLDPGVDEALRNRIVDFEIAVGLPVTFADIGLEGVDRQRLKTIGDICAGEGSLCSVHPFEVTSESVVDAMIAADALGTQRKAAAQH